MQIAAQAGEQDARRRAASRAARAAQIAAEKITQSLPLLDQQLHANEALLAKGYVSKLRVLEMQRQRMAAEQDRAAALESAAQASAEAGATARHAAASRAASRVDVLQMLVAAQADVAQRRGDLAISSGRADFGRLRAPVSGTVAQLAVTADGAMVDGQRPIMAIVPDGGLTAEVRLPNSEIGFVRPGQAVAVKVQAYPFSRYGTIAGQILSIGATTVVDDRHGLVYPVRVRLQAADARRFRLRPGMAVAVDIRTGQRRMIDYLLSPLGAVAATAGRER
jgi:hemolysin D